MCFSPCWSRPWRSPSRAADDNQDSHPVLVGIAHAKGARLVPSFYWRRMSPLQMDLQRLDHGMLTAGEPFGDFLHFQSYKDPALACRPRRRRWARPPGSSRRGRTWRDADRPARSRVSARGQASPSLRDDQRNREALEADVYFREMSGETIRSQCELEARIGYGFADKTKSFRSVDVPRLARARAFRSILSSVRLAAISIVFWPWTSTPSHSISNCRSRWSISKWAP
jgi:hypothetical protein